MTDKNEQNLPAKQDNEVMTSEVVTSNDVPMLLSQLVQKFGPDATGDMVAALKELAELQIKMEDRAAEKALKRDFAAFQSECPPVPKKSKAIGKHGETLYTYPAFEDITNFLKPYLDKYGFSYSFTEEIKDRMITTICTLHHVQGHSIASSFTSELAESGKVMRSKTQQYGATRTYGKRQSLLSMTGISAEEDTDGVETEEVEYITEEEVNSLMALLKNLSSDESVRNKRQAKFFVWINSKWNATKLEEIPREAIDEVVQELQKAISRHGDK